MIKLFGEEHFFVRLIRILCHAFEEMLDFHCKKSKIPGTDLLVSHIEAVEGLLCEVQWNR